MKKLIIKKMLLLIWVTIVCYSKGICQKPQLTVEELTEIAKKYDMQDRVATLKNSQLIYHDKAYAEQYFYNELKATKGKLEFTTFMSKTQNVKTYEHFFKLLDTYPSVKKGFLTSHNWNEVDYQKYIQSCMKYKWRIYRSTFGGLSFYRADTKLRKEELIQGVRIDNLPKPMKE